MNVAGQSGISSVKGISSRSFGSSGECSKALIQVFEKTINQSDLASGGSVVILAGSGAKQWKVRDIRLFDGGTNFSGGDRNLDIRHDSTVYSTIPNATLGALSYQRWDDAGLPVTAGNALTATSAGGSIVASYSGGATDHTAGECTVVVHAERIA